MNQKAKSWTPILLAISLVCIAPFEGGAVDKRFFLSRSDSESFWTATWPKSGVRAELARMQSQDGLTIGWYEHDGPKIVKFDKRAVLRGRRLTGQIVGGGIIGRDGTQVALILHDAAGQVSTLGIIQADGSNLREFLNVERPGPRGWSYDMSRLAMIVLNAQQSKVSLKVLDLGSKSVTD